MSITRIRRISACILITCVLVGCARREADDGAVADVAPDRSVGSTVQPPAAPPAAALSSVQLQISLAPRAEQALAEAGESVLVEVVYAGDPAPGASAAVNEFGLVEVARVTHELDGSGTLNLDKDGLDDGRLAQIEGQPHIIVNATSSRRSSGQNLLACPFYWETLSVASNSGIQIACDLHN